MILCLTVGGVYATWTFAGDADVIDANKEYTITMGGTPVSEGKYGSYSISMTHKTADGSIAEGLALIIDQADTTDMDAGAKHHQAVLRIDPTSKITITFTANDSAPVEIKQGKFDTKFHFGIERAQVEGVLATWKFPVDADGYYDSTAEPRDIFSIDTAEHVINNDTAVVAADQWEGGENNTWTYTITADELCGEKGFIKLANTFILDDLATFRAFEMAIAGNIRFYVTDGVTAGQ